MADSRAILRLLAINRHLLQGSKSKWGHRHPVQNVMAMATSAGAQSVLQTRQSVDVLDSRMSYLDTGPKGDKTVLFLHGNPTSAYLWRNVIPHVQDKARCLAPDLIGMGHSAKLPSHDYTFANHYRYLSAWIDKMDLPKKLNFVIHDWGSALGFHWCHQHQDRVQSIVYMEAVVGPVQSWETFPEQARDIFQALRSPAGEELVLKKNFFVERLLPGSILRELSPEEMEEYRRPFKEEGEDRRPTLTWPREIPVRTDGPEDVVKKVEAYNKWLSQSADIPKLFIEGDPGFFGPFLVKAVSKWPNQKTAKVKGLHFLQEDSPDEIGQATASFLDGV